MAFFSERERGPLPRVNLDVSENCWRGIVAAIQMRIDDGSFGRAFPKECSQFNEIIGTDLRNFEGAAAGANVPWPGPDYGAPELLGVMDLIEFCHQEVAKVIQREGCHFPHFHLSFDQTKGKTEFRQSINQIFARHGMAFELRDNGEVSRIPYSVLREEITQVIFDTGDQNLDSLLETARRKFLKPDPSERPAALEKLWDAWERLKSLEAGDKKQSVQKLLQKASKDNAFRELLNADAQELTDIGNRFKIRHFEKDKLDITETLHYDFLFHRLFAMIALLLRATKRL
jgi:hypothetical protein